jgi:hypothetical protein
VAHRPVKRYAGAAAEQGLATEQLGTLASLGRPARARAADHARLTLAGA